MLTSENYNTAKENTYPVGGIMTEQLATLYDVIEDKHIPQLISRYGKQYANLMMLFRSMGRELPLANIRLTAHEENRIHNNFKVASQVTNNSAKGTVDVTVDDAYAWGNVVYPRKGDIITLPSGVTHSGSSNAEKQVIVTAISGKTVTLKPVGNFAIGTIPANTMLAITNGAFGAGTDQPKGTVVGFTPRQFQAQIFKESVGLQGSEFVKEKWFKAIDDGRNLSKWYTTGLARAEYLLGLKIDGAFTVGDHNDSALAETADDGSEVEIMTTKGMVPWIRELGTTVDVSGGFEKEAIDALALYMKRQGVESGIALAIVGDKLMQSVEGEMVDQLSDTGVDYTRVERNLFKGNRELSVSWNFKTITSGGLTMAFHVHDNWSNPVTFDSPGLEFSNYGIILPMTTVKDPQSGVKMPNVSVRYMEMDGYSRRFETWSKKGAGGGQYVSSVDRADFYLRSHLMFHFVKANQAAILDPFGLGSS